MTHTCCTLVTHVMVLTLSLALHVAELSCHLVVAWRLYSELQHIWLSLQLGVLVVPMVMTQCVSLYWSWDAASRWGASQRLLWVTLHVAMLALPARYVRLLLTCRDGVYCREGDSQKELARTLQLRTLLTFCSSLPLLLLEVYVVCTGTLQSNAVVIAAAAVTLASSAASLSTFRKRTEDFRFNIITWPGHVFKLLWRLGEVGSRVVFLALFTQLYTLWIFMVLLGHWVCMLVSLLLETKLRPKSNGAGTTSLPRLLATSYAFVFCYLNLTTTKPEKYRFVVYYAITAVENALLLLLWILFDARDALHLPVSVATSATFCLSLVSAVVYYHCFHMKSSEKLPITMPTRHVQQCLNCSLRASVTGSQRDPREAQEIGAPYEWWVEVRASDTDHDSTDYLYPSECMVSNGNPMSGNQSISGGRTSGVLVPVQDVSEDGQGRVRYFRFAESGTSGTFLIPYPDPDSVSDTYSWDQYDLEDPEDEEGTQDPEDQIQRDPDAIVPLPSADTGSQPRGGSGTQGEGGGGSGVSGVGVGVGGDSNKPSDSGFSASTSSRSGSRLSPFSQGEYVLYISDNDDSDFSTSFVSTERGLGGARGVGVGGLRPIRCYLSDQWSVTTSTTNCTETLQHPGHHQRRRLLYRLPGGLARLHETKAPSGSHAQSQDNPGFQGDVAQQQEQEEQDASEGRVVLVPVRMCRNCGGSSSSSPGPARRGPRIIARKPVSERVLAERRRARKQRMANAKLVSRNRHHFRSHHFRSHDLRSGVAHALGGHHVVESSGGDADCSVTGGVVLSSDLDLDSSNERIPSGAAVKKGGKSLRLGIPSKKSTHTHVPITGGASPAGKHSKPSGDKSPQKKKTKDSGKSETKLKKKKKPWELTPENSIRLRERRSPGKQDLSPAGFELQFPVQTDSVVAMDTPVTVDTPHSPVVMDTAHSPVVMEDANATITV